MCGIWAYVLHTPISNIHTIDSTFPDNFKNALDASQSLQCRGPDNTSHHIGDKHLFAFHRLAIHDLSSSGEQPFIYHFPNGVCIELICNGEIYNYKELIQQFSFDMKSSSDCEVIGYLMYYYKFDIHSVLKILRGEFAFIAYVKHIDDTEEIIIGRDTFGVRPLYYGFTKYGLVLSSMISGIIPLQHDNEDDIKAYHFPPGNFYREEIKYIDQKTFKTCCKDVFTSFKLLPCVYKSLLRENVATFYKEITDTFIHAVKIRLDSERDVGFFLSGGLDSSLVVGVATKILGLTKPKTFCIGFDENAPDIQFAQKVVDHLDTDHTCVIVDCETAIASVPEVIKALETYDTTTIRASTPQYLLAKYISTKTTIKVILNGDGSDEVSMGYLYNFYAPDDESAHADSLRLLKEIHCFDGLRVDRTLGAHGLEARLPFLDIDYVKAYLNVPLDFRRPSSISMEKQLLRDAFNTLYPDLLPKEIMYRKKEAFSDGVSKVDKSWYKILQDRAFAVNKTEKEWYKEIFDREFPGQDHICPHFWMPQWTNATDPSARTLTVY
jgi:asparagine synthase (glutamine-hydrolysing)